MLPARGISEMATFQYPGKSSVYHVAILAGSWKICEFIHENMFEKMQWKDNFLKKPNVGSLTICGCSVLTSAHPFGFKIFKDIRYFREEFAFMASGANSALLQIAYLGQLNCVLFLEELMDNP